MDDVEILVHISAPSTRRDDERYRAEAAAYISFQDVRNEKPAPHGRTFSPSQRGGNRTTSFPSSKYNQATVYSPRLAHPLEHLETLQDQWRLATQQIRASSHEAAQREKLPLYIEDTQLALCAIESQVFDSSDEPSSNLGDTVNSCNKGHYFREQPSVTHSDHSKDSPPISNSNANDLQIQHAKPSQVPRAGDSENDLIVSRAKSTASLCSSSSSTDYSGSVAFSNLFSSMPASFGLTGCTVTALNQGKLKIRPEVRASSSDLPVAAAEDVSIEKADEKVREISPKTSNDSLYILGSLPANPIIILDSPMSDSDQTAAVPVTMKEPPFQFPTEPEAMSPQSETRPASRTCDSISMAVNPQNSDFSTLPREVQPPPAEVGFGSAMPWPSQSTPMLNSLLRNPNTRDRYRPSLVSRSVQPVERGYWAIDASFWPLQDQFDFWANMTDFITTGRGGWGMWMTRAREDQTPPATELGEVHVWCWGELIEHIYLLIWTLSDGKVTTSRAEWWDGLGRLAIRMPVLGSE
jgi:hypothetical protein